MATILLSVAIKTLSPASETDAQNMASWLNDLIIEQAPFELEYATVGVDEVDE